MLTARLESWRKEAALHQDFQRSMSTNFTVLFEGPAEQPLADKALALLEASYWRIGGALGAYPADVITVVLYTERQFQDVTRAPGWAGGLYDGRIKVPVRGALEHPEEFARVLSHELTHAFVYSLATRGVPQWLNEGLAGAFEQGDLSWAHETVAGARALIPLDRLHGDFSGFSPDQARLAYAESALAAKYLLDRIRPRAGRGLAHRPRERRRLRSRVRAAHPRPLPPVRGRVGRAGEVAHPSRTKRFPSDVASR